MVNDDWVLRKVLEFNKKTKPATPENPGVVKVGSGLYIDSEGSDLNENWFHERNEFSKKNTYQ